MARCSHARANVQCRSAVLGETPPPPPPPGPAVATITLTAATTNIPVNANKTNASAWRFVGGTELPGLPLIRDFDLAPMRNLSTWNGVGNPPAGPAIEDPELKKMTATVFGSAETGEIKVEVIYPDGFTGGRIRLWADQTKTAEILLSGAGSVGDGGGKYASGTGTLPNYPTSDFYVEGTRPSLAADDITIRVSYTQGAQTVTTNQTVTVTPVVNEFSVNPKDPSTTTFFKTMGGVILGMSSGEQANGTDPGTTKRGVKYTADLNVKGIDGGANFVQNVTALSHGAPAVVLTNGNQYNPSFGTATFPILDTFTVNPPVALPLYPSLRGAVYDSNRQMIWSEDTPALASPDFAGLIQSMDLTFQARMYLVWKYADETLYTLARANWQVVFQAATAPIVGLTLSPNSVVSASPNVITNADPAKVVGSTYNSFLADAAAFWVIV